jgi:hypothetical protein
MDTLHTFTITLTDDEMAALEAHAPEYDQPGDALRGFLRFVDALLGDPGA